MNHIPLGATKPDALEDARLQLHWAVQIPASVGYTFVDPEPDWGHVSLSSRMVAGAYTLVSRPADGFRCGLRLHDATLLVFDNDELKASFALDGSTLDEGFAWLTEKARSALNTRRGTLIRPDHELPAHPVGDGKPFTLADLEAFQELASWYANAELALQEVAKTNPEASAIRCWPHHFDLATLLTLDPDKDPEEARSIGVGLSPGDGSYDEPYFYITPWPYPDADRLPFLEGGHWHTEGWIGAVLVGSELLQANDRAAYLSDFLQSGVAASRRVLSDTR